MKSKIMVRKKAATRRSRTPLSRVRVVEVAMELADAHGVDALSMRKLAQALGVEAMSLYNHVANKDDLLDAMVEHVVGRIELPEIGGDWVAAMRVRARSAHAVLLRHPWAPLLIMSRVNVGPAMLAYVEATVGCLREAGFSWELVDHGWNALDNHIYGFTLQALNFPFEPQEYAAAAAEYLPMLPPDQYPHMHAMSVEVAEGRHAGIQDFDFGLDLILEGLRSQLVAV